MSVPSNPSLQNHSEIDFTEANTFLEAFADADASHVFQLLPERDGLTGNAPSYVGRFDDLREQLADGNANGFGVFVTVNECQGPRKAENIRSIRAVFVDLDGAPLEPALQAEPPPQIIVESSAGRWHVYWVVDGSVPLEEFRPLQKALATKFGGDPMVCDLPRLMRVPGFLHHKRQPPFLSRLETLRGDPSYALGEMQELLGLEPTDDGPPEPRARHEPPGAQVERYAALTLARCLRNVAAAPDGTRNASLNSAAFTLGGLVGAGLLAEDDVVAELQEAAQACGLQEPEISRTVRSGLGAGRARPFVPEHVGENAEVDILVDDLNERHALTMVGGRAVVVNLQDDDNGFTFSSKQDFLNRYSNVASRERRGERSYFTVAEIWFKHPRRRTYSGLVFEPGAVPDVGGKLNLWRGFAVEAIEGDCSLYQELLREGICGGDASVADYVLDWMAHAVQRPAELPGTALVLKSGQGTGKNTLVDFFGGLFGPRHFTTLTSQEQLTGRFNGHLAAKVIVFANEAVWGGNKTAEGRLKAMITDPIETVERKGLDPTTERNTKRLIVASNNGWVVPVEADDRRFVIVPVSNRYQGDRSFFERLYQQMAAGGSGALLYQLLTRDISRFDPAERPTSAALREATLEQKLHALPSTSAFWLHQLQIGCVSLGISYPEQPSEQWSTTIPVATLHGSYLTYCKSNGLGHPCAVDLFSKRLKEMCPSISRGRVKEVGKRTYKYKLPPLETARKEFEMHIKETINWHQDDE